MKRALVCVAAAAAVLVAGCAGASNNGGDTVCRDFLTMRTDDMDAVVARMLKERNGRNASTMDVINTRLKLVGACEPADKGDVKVGELA